MASRSRWLTTGLVLVAAAAAGFLVVRGGADAVRDGDPPMPSHQARKAPALPEEPGPPTALGPSATESAPLQQGRGTDVGPEAGPTGVGQQAEAGTPEEQRLAEGMVKIVRDLEFSPGLPEPTQQTVRPQPEPWRPDPSREGPPPIVEEVTPHLIRTAGGDRVTIRGRNLRVVQVMFGTAPARLLAATGTQVAVEAPASSAGPVTIAVTNDDGTWALAGTPILYEE